MVTDSPGPAVIVLPFTVACALPDIAAWICGMILGRKMNASIATTAIAMKVPVLANG